ncbi:DNA polymerase III subunit chi [Gammaproteobacteria bacterium]|nr:MAG: DNA polymerase III subunit chi [Gammaproteobacteria bacterium]CAG0941819.1 DNA polymerase III subunit chi [Gammaproteobacteria bacterium]
MSLPEPGRVDFYVLAVADPGARLRFACRLAEKAYRLQHRVHLHAGSPAQATQLDELLWTFRQGSFVPHEVIAADAAAGSPVTIGHGPGNPPAAGLLINLADELPAFAATFPRVAEVIDDTDAGRQRGRERFRRYREAGREISSHDIGAEP